MRKVELALAALLALGGAGHFAGTLVFYEPGTEIFVWSLSASAFVFMLVFLHVLRIRRGTDGAVTAAATVGTLAWIGLALAFGAAADGIADPRVLLHVGASAGLVVTTLVGRRRHAARGRAGALA